MPTSTEQPDGSVIIDLSDAEKQADNNATNLAEILSPEELVTIGDTVVTEFDADLASRADWEKRRGNWYKLFSGMRDAKNFPWDNCSNVGIPTIGIAVLQFQARAFESLFGQKEVVRAKWNREEAKDAALRVGKYMNYQLTEEMEEWEEDMDAMLVQLPLNGSCFKKTYYDHLLKRIVSIFVDVDDFVVPYSARRLETAARKTHVLHPFLDEVKRRESAGEYINASELVEVTDEMWKGANPSITAAKELVSGLRESPMNTARPRIVLEQHRSLDLNKDGLSEHYVVTVDYFTKKVLRIEPREYIDEKGIRNVVEYFTHYGFIPNPEGFYHFGFGHFMEGLNEAINSIVNQLVDAGTLQNTVGGFYSKRSGLKAADLRYKMGEFKGADVGAEDIRKAIYQMNFNTPSDVLFNLLALLQDYGSKISTVSDSMIGQMPPSDTAATTMLAILEQGLKVFTTIQKRIHRSLKKELKKIFILNSIYLDEKEYAMVQDPAMPEAQTMTIVKADFQNPIDVIPVSDPNMSSKAEQLLKAETAYKFGMSNPLVASNPEAVFELTKDYYRALGTDSIERIVKMPAPQEPPDVPPIEENAGFIQEQSAVVVPQQDHVAHMEAHLAFQASGWSTSLTPQGRKVLEAHLRDTAAAIYKMEAASGQGNVGSMAALAGNAGVSTAASGKAAGVA